MLQARCHSVLGARSQAEFRDEVVNFAKDLGFATVTAITVVDHIVGEPEFIAIHNAPEGFSDAMSDPLNGRLDPVMQHCKRQSVPIVWDQGTYVGAGMGDMWEQQASFGFRTGVCLALHMPEGRHFVLGVDRDQPLPSDQDEVTRIVADLQLFAVHAQDTAMRVLVPARLRPDTPKVTPRELEALRWTMEGKTAWEVGAVMGIAERTAVLHINTAMHKLECSNKHQAVLKALRLGLIR